MGFDAGAKERNLIAESEAWDTTRSVPAEAGEKVGFFLLTGHGVDSDLISRLFADVKRFHQLPTATKEQLAMDRSGAIVGSG